MIIQMLFRIISPRQATRVNPASLSCLRGYFSNMTLGTVYSRLPRWGRWGEIRGSLAILCKWCLFFIGNYCCHCLNWFCIKFAYFLCIFASLILYVDFNERVQTDLFAQEKGPRTFRRFLKQFNTFIPIETCFKYFLKEVVKVMIFQNSWG